MKDEFDQLQLRKLDGGLLLVFRELLARRRASEVAQRLGLSPSAISHALTRLRDVFDDPLFIRRSHGLEPTQKALEYGPRVETLIDLMGAMVGVSGAFDPAASKRRFAVACPDAIASLLGDGLVRAFRAEAPGALFTMRPIILERAAAAVRRGEIDLAIGVFEEIAHDLTATLLYEDEYCVVARRRHPQIKGSVDRATYASVGHIFVGMLGAPLADEAPIDRKVMDATYGALPGPDVVRTHAYVAQWETAMLMVSQTDALAECPKRLAERFAPALGLQILKPPFRPFRFKVRAVRRRGASDPGVDWFLAKVVEAVG